MIFGVKILTILIQHLGILVDDIFANNFSHTTAVYFVPNHLGLYSVKVISTENSVQRLRNKKLNKTKCDFLGQIRLVTSSPDSPTPSPPLGGMGVNI